MPPARTTRSRSTRAPVEEVADVARKQIDLKVLSAEEKVKRSEAQLALRKKKEGSEAIPIIPAPYRSISASPLPSARSARGRSRTSQTPSAAGSVPPKNVYAPRGQKGRATSTVDPSSQVTPREALLRLISGDPNHGLPVGEAHILLEGFKNGLAMRSHVLALLTEQRETSSQLLALEKEYMSTDDPDVEQDLDIEIDRLLRNQQVLDDLIDKALPIRKEISTRYAHLYQGQNIVAHKQKESGVEEDENAQGTDDELEDNGSGDDENWAMDADEFVEDEEFDDDREED